MQADVSQSNRSGNDPVIFVEIPDGYTFRNLIEFLKNTNTSGNFIFTKDRITYSRADATNSILNEILILGCNLTYYIYNSPLPEIVIGVTISNLRKITKPIGKKDSVRLYMLPNDPLLYIQIVSVNTKALSRNNANFVMPQKIDRLEYDPGQYLRSEENPNCTIPIMDFCKMCTSMHSISCSYVTIRGLPRGSIFEGMMEGGITGRIDKFGIVDNQAPTSVTIPDMSAITPLLNDLCLDKIRVPVGKAPKLVIKSAAEMAEIRTRVRIATIKALSKINNLSPPAGIVKLYIERGVPLKLICNIGTYGKLIIYLRDIEN